FAEGSRDAAHPRQFRDRFSRSPSRRRAHRRVRRYVEALMRHALILSLGLLILPFTAYAQPAPPELTRPVNDFANVIDAASEAEIERRILELKNASGDIVVVATIDTFAPYADIREYAVKMFENRGRGIGAKGKDNGLLMLLAVKDRDVWNEVGYDLEQFVT